MTSYVRTPFIDLLVADGEAIALYENRFVRLGVLATWIVGNTGTPRSVESLADELSETFGAPSDTAPRDATQAVLIELVAQSVIAEVTND